MSDNERIPPSVHLALVAVQLMFASLAIVGKMVLRELPPFGLIALRVPAATLVLLVVRALMRPAGAGGAARPARDRASTRSSASSPTSSSSSPACSARPPPTPSSSARPSRCSPSASRWSLRKRGGDAGQAARPGGRVRSARWSSSAPARFEAGGRRLVGNLLVRRQLAVVLDLPGHQRGGCSRAIAPMTVVTWTFVFGALGVLPFGARDLVARGAARCRRRLAARSSYIVAVPDGGHLLPERVRARRAPASLVAIYIYVQPVVGALLAAAALGERPSAATSSAARSSAAASGSSRARRGALAR